MGSKLVSIIWFCIILFNHNLLASVQPDTSLAKSYYNQAKVFVKQAQSDSSNYYFQQSGRIYEKFALEKNDKNAWEMYIQCLNHLAINAQERGSYDNATEILNKAKSVCQKQLGPDHYLNYYILDNIGIGYYYKGDYDKVLEYFRKALEIKKRLKGEDSEDIAVSYNNISMILEAKGDYDNALNYYEKSLAIKLRTLGPDHFKVANTYHNLGNLYVKLKDYGQAEENYQKALEIRLKVFDKDHPYIARLYNNMGILYKDMGKYELAMDYYHKSLTLKLKKLAANSPNLVTNYQNLGQLHQKNHNLDSALVYFQKSLDISGEAFGEKHLLVARSYSHLGLAFMAREDYQQAIAYFQKAIISNVYDFNDSNYYAQPSLDTKIGIEIDLLVYLLHKGIALEKFYSEQSDDLRDLEASLETLQLAMTLLEKLRGSYLPEESKLVLNENAAVIVEKAIEVALKLYDVIHDENYQHLAFTLAEKGKSSVLLGALQELEARRFSGIPDTLLETEHQLRLDLAFYETQIQKALQKTKGEETEMIRQLKENYFSVNQRAQQLIATFEREYPAYFELKYKTEPATVTEIQSLLDSESGLLEYFLGDSVLTIFYIAKDGCQAKAVKTGIVLPSLVEDFTNAIKKLDFETYLKTSANLYSLLIQPFEDELHSKHKLLIVPHGMLYKIPFEALVRQAPENAANVSFSKLDYLIKNMEISYQNSATLYMKNLAEKQTFVHNKSINEKAFLGFAPVFDDKVDNGYVVAENSPALQKISADDEVRAFTFDGQRFKPLAYSETEVKTILRLYQKQKEDALGFFHENASEENLKSTVGQGRCVHIASHGIIYEDNPRLSGIILSQPTDSMHTEDGILYAGETYNLNLHADLVVLSSCESGIGKLVRGEGLMALTRGFLFSGAHNLVVSLWKVSDKHTSELMIAFYENILKGQTYSKALRNAKLKLIKNEKTAFPKSWSGFVLIGE